MKHTWIKYTTSDKENMLKEYIAIQNLLVTDVCAYKTAWDAFVKKHRTSREECEHWLAKQKISKTKGLNTTHRYYL